MLFNRLIFTSVIILGGYQFIKLSGGSLLKARGYVAVGIKGYLYAGTAQTFLNYLEDNLTSPQVVKGTGNVYLA